MMSKKNLCVCAVYYQVLHRLEYISEVQSDCRHVIELFAKTGRTGFELLRFDLCPLYYDRQFAGIEPDNKNIQKQKTK